MPYLFIHSWIDNVHLGCFHILATMYNVAITIYVWVIVLYILLYKIVWYISHNFISPRKISVSRTAQSYSNSIFKISVTAKLFSKTVASFNIPISHNWEFQFLHIFMKTYFLKWYSSQWVFSDISLWFYFFIS